MHLFHTRTNTLYFSLSTRLASLRSCSQPLSPLLHSFLPYLLPTMIVLNPTPRGAFIVLEGVDRCGKTTQCALLLKHLLSLSVAAMAMRFPNRTTPTGLLIDQYLQSNNNLDDRAIHLLFSANRWEVAPTLQEQLVAGKTVICDRYAYSGVAFSSAKPEANLDLTWCQAPDVGLPAPDAVIFLDIAQDQAEQRGGYGGERYEKRELQLRVRQRFAQLQAQDERLQTVPWHVVDAAQSIEEVQKEINTIVLQTVESVQEQQQKGKPMPTMWNHVLGDTSTGAEEKEKGK